MDKNYRIVVKNYPADLVERVSLVHAVALLSWEKRAGLQPPDSTTPEYPDTVHEVPPATQ